jgi:hypothetical protein
MSTLSGRRKRSEVLIQRPARSRLISTSSAPWTSNSEKILREVSEELGQLPSRNPTDAAPVKASLTDFDVLVEVDGKLAAVQQ